jgi:hypothetical protein
MFRKQRRRRLHNKVFMPLRVDLEQCHVLAGVKAGEERGDEEDNGVT